MYFLNYVDRNAIAQARLNNFEEDLGLVGNQFNTAVSMYATPPPPSLGPSNIQSYMLTIVQSLRWLRPHANPQQHAHHPHQARYLHELLDAGLGRCVCLHGPRSQLRRHRRLSILPWYHRGPVLPRSDIHALHLLHA